jgi:hypothetical protein
MTKKNAALPTKQSPAPDPKKDRASGKENKPLRERAKAVSREGMREMFDLFTPQEQAAGGSQHPHSDNPVKLSGTGYGGLMKDELRYTRPELHWALQKLLKIGILRPNGEYRNGRMVYELTPDAELSDEARAYDAYLKSFRKDTQVN